MGSLRMGSLRTEPLRPAACAYARQSPVRPSQQPTLKRHRGHWNVPWRHSIAAAQRGQGSTAGSGAVSAGGEAAIRRRYAARRTAVEGVWVPRTPSGHPRARAGRTPGDPALRSPVPTSGSRATRASVPGVDTREPRRARGSLSLQIDEATSGSAGGWCCWRGRRLAHHDWTTTHLGTGRCSAPVFRNVPRWLCRAMICVHLSDLTEKALLVPSKRGSTR